jgi:hypothetical protein
MTQAGIERFHARSPGGFLVDAVCTTGVSSRRCARGLLHAPILTPVSAPHADWATLSVASSAWVVIVLVSDLPSAASVMVRVRRCWPAGVPSAA